MRTGSPSMTATEPVRMSMLSQLVPGFGLAKGMALGLIRFFQPKATIMYPEEPADNSTRFRGRLQLLYDEYGTLKCETCFQCAQACPIECIDMGGIDTKNRYHVHWGPPETYGERREESALRRSGRTVPDRAYEHFDPVDVSAVDAILERYDFDPKQMLQILEAVNEVYGYLPVGALKRISSSTGAWYAMIYGTATYYRHLRLDPPAERDPGLPLHELPAGRRRPDPRGASRARSARSSARGPVRAACGSRRCRRTSPGAASPLVAVDGTPQPDVTLANAASWARGL